MSDYFFFNNGQITTAQFGLTGTNFCGPGYTGGRFVAPDDAGNFNVRALNPLDEACKTHDRRYADARGKPDQELREYYADQQLIRDLSWLNGLNQLWIGVENQQAAMAALYFTMKSTTLSYASWHVMVSETQFKRVPALANSGFSAAKSWRPSRDPLLLDLDGDGLETVDLSVGIHFDHDGDGILTGTGWAAADDGILVRDLNGNGMIDSGAELFGDFTRLADGSYASNGYAALAMLDRVYDGVIDAADPAWASLRVWQDANQDGVSQAGELRTLDDAGIVSLGLDNTLRNKGLGNGNTLAREGSLTRSDGSSGAMSELQLATNTADTRFAQAIAVPDALKDLPNLQGSGKVRELQQAATLSPGLEALLRQFQAAETHADQMALLDQMLEAWADTSGMKTLEQRAVGYNIDYVAFGSERESNHRQGGVLSSRYLALIAEWRSKMHVLEAFNGQYFYNLPGERSQTASANSGMSRGGGGGGGSGGIAPPPVLSIDYSQQQLDLLGKAYTSLRENVYGALVLQTRLKPYLDQIDLLLDDNGLRLDASAVDGAIAAKLTGDPLNGVADLLDLDRYASNILSGTAWKGLAEFDTLATSLPQTPEMAALLAEFGVRSLTDGDDRLGLGDAPAIVMAGDGDDRVVSGQGRVELFGQGGNDMLKGGAGNDLLSGGAGDDALYGYDGADTYVFGRGYGHDSIYDMAESGQRLDCVRLVGLTPQDIAVSADDSDNLILTIRDTGETLAVPYRGDTRGYFNGVGQYVFGDGTVWSHDDVLRATVPLATTGDDTIRGSSAADTIEGAAGNDLLIGRGGDDVLDGGSGDDLLLGSPGWNTTFENGEWMVGYGAHRQIVPDGNDTYLFGTGDGKDTVVDLDASAGNTDTLRFKNGVRPDDVRVKRGYSTDLVLSIIGTDDQVTLKWYFNRGTALWPNPSLIERIEFEDGTSWDFEDVQARLFAGSEDSELLIGSDGADVIHGLAGDDTLWGGTGSDVLDGGAGNDVLRGNSALGGGNLPYEAGADGDTYRFGFGDGNDVIVDDAWSAAGVDRLELKDNVSPGDVRLRRVRSTEGGKVIDDLVVKLRGSTDSIVVKRHFDESGRFAVEEIVFSNGEIWDAAEIRRRVLLGEGGDDALIGFAGSDDMLVGGVGDDVLQGQTGSDTYRFGVGDGDDIIEEAYDSYAVDVVQLGIGIGPDDVTVRWTAQGDLAIRLTTGETLLARGQANGTGIEALRFDNGDTWDISTLQVKALSGSVGADRVVGTTADDVIDGGAGDDVLVGLQGYDSYRFGFGDGNEIVDDGSGRLVFKSGVQQNGVTFSCDGDDLLASLGNGSDSVRVRGWMSSASRIDQFVFEGTGATIGVIDVFALMNVSAGAELLFGSSNGEPISGTGKDSRIYGRAGDDTLSGGAGDDMLYGEDGADVLNGGSGRDVLYAGEGQNTFVFERGNELDWVDVASHAVADDTVVFGADIRPQDVTVQLGESVGDWNAQPGDIGYASMVVGVGGNDALMLRNAIGQDLNRGAVRHFRFTSDNTVMSLADMVALADGGWAGWQIRSSGDSGVLVGSEGEDVILDSAGASMTVRARGNDDRVELDEGNDVVSAGAGRDVVDSGDGDDVLAGEQGNDTLAGGAGNDVFVFNAGDGRDVVTAGSGVDTLSFGVGVTPEMLALAPDRDGNLEILVNGGTGGSIALTGISADLPSGGLERMQFVDGGGHVRVFDLVGWVKRNAAALAMTGEDAPLSFDGQGFELTGTIAPAGGLETVAYAQADSLFASPSFADNIATAGSDVLFGTDSADDLDAGEGADTLIGVRGNDSLHGGGGRDLIMGGEGDDLLEGNDGDDELHGGWGADTLSGGTGSDALFGEWGGDTYSYRLGDGGVTIDDGHGALNLEGGCAECGSEEVPDVAANILSFGPNIRPEDLRYSESNGDLVIEIVGHPDDRLVLRGYDASRATLSRSVDVFRFDDGYEIAAASIEQAGRSSVGGDEGGWLEGTGFADTLTGGRGDDVLDGQGGADRLAGGVGNDTYRVFQDWNRVGNSETSIIEIWRAGDSNRIELTGDVTSAGLYLEFDDHDLLLRLGEGGGSIRFVGFDPRVPGMPAPVAEIDLPQEGVVLDFDMLLQRGVRLVGSSDASTFGDGNIGANLWATAGDDSLSGGAGGDVFTVGENGGLDTIYDLEAGASNNLLILPEGTGPDDVRLSFDQEGFLLLDIERTGTHVRLAGFDPLNPLGQRAVDRFRFGPSGVEISYEALLARGFDITGTAGDDVLSGTKLVDRIEGASGDDLIEASPGGDLLAGGAGDDVYLINRGDGQVNIEDLASATSGNVVRFGPGIAPETLHNNLRYEPDGNGGHTMIIPYGAEGDELRLSGFDPNDVAGGVHAVDRFEFSTGVSVDYATLVSWTFVVEGDNLPNVLNGTSVGDRLYGYDDDDVLSAGSGDDVLTGGAGDDDLSGGEGRDAYVFNLWDGADTILDGVDAGQGNVITFGSGISRDDVTFEQSGGDLLIHYGDFGDVVRVRDCVLPENGGSAVIDMFEFADGSRLTLSEFMNTAPVVMDSVPDQLAVQDGTFSFVLPEGLFADADGDVVYTSLVGTGGAPIPAWLHYDPETRTLFGTPGNVDVGDLVVMIQGMDRLGAAAYHGFHLNVANVNDAPTLAITVTDQTTDVGQPFVFVLPGGGGFMADSADLGTAPRVLPDYVYQSGAVGNDTYVFARGAGDLLISDSDETPGNIDTVVFGTDISPDEVAVDVTQWGQPRISIAGSADTLTLEPWDTFPANRIEQFVFSNGVVWTADHLMGMISAAPSGGNDRIQGAPGGDEINGQAGDDYVVGSDGNDTLRGGAGYDQLRGGGGSDLLSGGSGDDAIEADETYSDLAGDVLLGGAGNDMLWAGVSNDLLLGGEGDDLMNGDAGADVILFNRGDGNDVLQPYLSTGDETLAARRDTLSLGGGISYEDLAFERNGDDLILTTGNDESVTFEGWFTDPANHSVATLQMIVDSIPGFSPLSTDPLLNQRVKQLDFLALANSFESALADDPTISSWQLAPWIRDFVIGGSNITAIGGDMAYMYGRAGSLARLNETDVLAEVGSSDFAALPQQLTKAPGQEVQALFDDVDAIYGDRLTYSATLADGSALPDWLHFDPSSMTFTGTPSIGDSGGVQVMVSATDRGGLSTSVVFGIDVLSSNSAPVVVDGIADQVAFEDVEFSFTVPATAFVDSDAGDSLEYCATRADGTALPDWLTFDSTTRTFHGQPANDDVGELALKVVAIDSGNLSASTEFDLSVINVNDAPTVSLPIEAQSVLEDTVFNFVVPEGTFADIDMGDQLSLSATLADGNPLPAWLVFDTATGSFSGTPGNGDVGSLVVRVTGTDLAGASAASTFTLSVANVNDAPALVIPAADQAATEGVGFALSLPQGTFNDIDVGDALTYTATLASGAALPAWLSFNGASLSFSGTPTAADIGSIQVKVSAADLGGLSACTDFLLNIGQHPAISLVGTANGDTLTGYSGDDTLDGGAGADTLVGGLGNDTYIVDNSADSVVENPNQGCDTVLAAATYVLAENVEKLTLTGSANINATGNALDNVLTGNAGTNVLAGGGGNDTYYVGVGDTVSESVNGGVDTVIFELASGDKKWILADNVENLILRGNASLNGFGNALDNQITGTAKTNILDGGAGVDTLIGGGGDDGYVVDNINDVIVELAGEGRDFVNALTSYALPDNVEDLTLMGNGGINCIGNGLDNRLSGNQYANLVSGGAGNDSLDGGTGVDTLVGGIGNDTYYVDNASDVITENAGEGEEVVYSSVTRVLGGNLEHLILSGYSAINGTGNASNNLVRGNAYANSLNGAAGLDFLEGLAGNDTLVDTSGNNYLHGGGGADVLTAGSGSDMLIGGSGNDTLTGANGYDVFLFNKGDGVDTLTVGTGAHDTLSLGGGIAYGDLAFRKSGNDLVLDTGNGESMTFKNWYVGTANKNVLNLQVCVEAMAGFDPNSSNPLLSSKIEDFDFKGLAGAYDSALAANPALTSWALSNGLTQFHLSSSDSAALGGDLAYQYGKGGTLAGIGITSAQQVMGDSQFGVQTQTLRPFSGLQDGVVQLS